MALVIEKEKINDWLQYLRKRFVVYGPQEKNDEVIFKKVGAKTTVKLDLKKTTLPAKQFFLPSREKIFSYDVKKNKLAAAKSPEKFVVFGLAYVDLEAIAYLDQVMKEPQKDFFYWQKRKKATLIGLVNKSMRIVPGGDLILEKINEQQYQTLVLTKSGKKIVSSKFFKQVKEPQKKNYPVKKTKLKEMLLDSELLAEAVSWSWQGYPAIWNDLAKKCLGCGICTYVCPLCYCFSNEDRISLDGRQCSRCRYWDACTLPGFAQVAGGHNFHATLKQRYYNWYYHKFVRGYKEYGRSLCVACKRCKKYCPARINIEEVLSQILKNYLKSQR